MITTQKSTTFSKALVKYEFKANSFWDISPIDNINTTSLTCDMLIFKKIKAMMFPQLFESEEYLQLNDTGFNEIEYMLFYLYSVNTVSKENRLEKLLHKILKGELNTYLDVLTFIILYSSDSAYYSRIKQLNRFNYLINQHSNNKQQVQILRALYLDSCIHGKSLMPSFPSRLRKASLPSLDDLKIPNLGIKELAKSYILNPPPKRLTKDTKVKCDATTIQSDLKDNANFHLARRRLALDSELLSMYTKEIEPFNYSSDIGAFTTFNYSQLWFSNALVDEVSTQHSLVTQEENLTFIDQQSKTLREDLYTKTLQGCDFKKIENLKKILTKEGLTIEESFLFSDAKHVPAYSFILQNLELFSKLFPKLNLHKLKHLPTDVNQSYIHLVKSDKLAFTLRLHYSKKESTTSKFKYSLIDNHNFDYSDYENYLHHLYTERLVENNSKTLKFKEKIKLKVKKRREIRLMYLKRKATNDSKKISKKKLEFNNVVDNEVEERITLNQGIKQTKSNFQTQLDTPPSLESETIQAEDMFDIMKVNVYLTKMLPYLPLQPQICMNILKVFLNNDFYNYRICGFQTLDFVAIVSLLNHIQYKDSPVKNRPAVLLPNDLLDFLSDGLVERKISNFLKTCEECGFDPLTIISFMCDNSMKPKFQTILIDTKAVYPLNKPCFIAKKRLIKQKEVVTSKKLLDFAGNDTAKILDVTSIAFNYDLFLNYGSRIVKTLAFLIETDYELKKYLTSTRQLKTPLIKKALDTLIEQVKDPSVTELPHPYQSLLNTSDLNEDSITCKIIESGSEQRKIFLEAKDQKTTWLNM